MAKKESRAYRKAQREYWAKLGVDYDKMWEQLLEKYGKSMSIVEFLCKGL